MAHRPARLVSLETLAWVALLPMLGLCLTQWFGIEGHRAIAAFQALTPWVLVSALPIALAAAVSGRHLLALTALVPLGTLLVLSYPIVFHADAPKVADDSPQLTIAYANLLYSNPVPTDAAQALLEADADVMVMVELDTPLYDSMVRATTPGDYPYRSERTDLGSESIGVWSRLPIQAGGLVLVDDRPTIDLALDVDGDSVRVLAVHPYPPTRNAVGWSKQLRTIGERAADSTLPTIVLGDFNGSRWHPSFRALLATGLRDSQEALGHGWGVSWPTDSGIMPPPFVRIDHALFGDGMTPLAIADLDAPGSDHKGFVVTFGFTKAA